MADSFPMAMLPESGHMAWHVWLLHTCGSRGARAAFVQILAAYNRPEAITCLICCGRLVLGRCCLSLSNRQQQEG